MIQCLYLGRVDYGEGLRLQAEVARLRLEGRVENVLLLLEHPPVLTLGRNAKRTNVLASAELLARRGVTLHEIDRGGDVTYHGPGQLVGYPIFDLRSLRNPSGGRMGPVDFVRRMEEALILLCAGFGVRAGRIPGLTGVWCGVNQGSGIRDQGSEIRDQGSEVRDQGSEIRDQGSEIRDQGSEIRDQGSGIRDQGSGSDPAGPERKIAAIGIHVSRGITTHGFAFNVTTDLRDFALIVPCGIPNHAVTSLEHEVARPEELPSLEAVAHRAAREFGLVFEQQVLAVESLAALRAQAAAAAPNLPAEDTPLRVPAEVERLMGKEGRPILT